MTSRLHRHDRHEDAAGPPMTCTTMPCTTMPCTRMPWHEDDLLDDALLGDALLDDALLDDALLDDALLGAGASRLHRHDRPPWFHRRRIVLPRGNTMRSDPAPLSVTTPRRGESR
jgi:hypothetical protein